MTSISSLDGAIAFPEDFKLKINKGLTSLLEELGGESACERRVEEILRAFYKKMSKDLMLGFFFVGKDLTHIIRQQKSFLLRAMGTKEIYRGKSPSTAHLEIPPILKGHFDRRLVLLKETLKNSKISEEGVKTWINFEEQFRASIVEEERPLKK